MCDRVNPGAGALAARYCRARIRSAARFRLAEPRAVSSASCVTPAWWRWTSHHPERPSRIRLALGDTPAGIIALVVAGHVVTVLGGLIAGGLVAAAAVRMISGYLYSVTAYDAGTWLLAACVVVMAAAGGALVPALRAGAINPVDALRAE